MLPTKLLLPQRYFFGMEIKIPMTMKKKEAKNSFTQPQKTEMNRVQPRLIKQKVT